MMLNGQSTKGQIIGYARVSTEDQNLDRQLKSIGSVDRLFTEKISGKDRSRPALNEMLEYARAGDHIKAHSLDRLGRSAADLENLINEMGNRGITIEFISQNLKFVPGESDPMAIFQRQLFSAMAEFERALIRERQAEGIEIAKAKGVYSKPRKKKLTPEQIEDVKRKVAGGASVRGLAKQLDVSRTTLYAHMKQ